MKTQVKVLFVCENGLYCRGYDTGDVIEAKENHPGAEPGDMIEIETDEFDNMIGGA